MIKKKRESERLYTVSVKTQEYEMLSYNYIITNSAIISVMLSDFMKLLRIIAFKGDL